MDTFWASFIEDWVTFYSNIWSHCFRLRHFCHKIFAILFVYLTRKINKNLRSLLRFLHILGAVHMQFGVGQCDQFGLFLKFLATHFRAIVAQIFGFWGNIYFLK